ncbi:hypothetical protein [Nocardia niwae]|uniref:hypothetical protein n=1 Tax=Nocardia niwae TaxID=626084 RepID=UPI00340D7228
MRGPVRRRPRALEHHHIVFIAARANRPPVLRPGPDLLDAATATDGPGTGWDLHELRHSGLTHLGEAGASLLELMTKSRHRKVENRRRYFKPSP